jgi:hypothetical protein
MMKADSAITYDAFSFQSSVAGNFKYSNISHSFLFCEINLLGWSDYLDRVQRSLNTSSLSHDRVTLLDRRPISV